MFRLHKTAIIKLTFLLFIVRTAKAKRFFPLKREMKKSVANRQMVLLLSLSCMNN